MVDELYSGSVGVVFRTIVYDSADLATPMDLEAEGLDRAEALFRKPNGVVLTRSLNFVTDGTDGEMQYTFVAGELVDIGVWSYRAIFYFANGSIFPSNPGSFEVKKVFT